VLYIILLFHFSISVCIQALYGIHEIIVHQQNTHETEGKELDYGFSSTFAFNGKQELIYMKILDNMSYFVVKAKGYYNI
jgi:hypothetical protein